MRASERACSGWWAQGQSPVYTRQHVDFWCDPFGQKNVESSVDGGEFHAAAFHLRSSSLPSMVPRRLVGAGVCHSSAVATLDKGAAIVYACQTHTHTHTHTL